MPTSPKASLVRANLSVTAAKRPSSSAAAALLARDPARRRQQLARDVATIVGRLAPAAASGKSPAGSVDFPAFVAGLLQGVFEAIVNSSIQQMDAYAALLAEVAKAADEFMSENVSPEKDRDSLLSRFPDLTTSGANSGTSDDDPKKRKLRRARKSKAQQLAENRVLLSQLALRAVAR